MVETNFHDALAAGYKAASDRTAVQIVLDQQLAAKNANLPFSQDVIDSCNLYLKENSRDKR